MNSDEREPKEAVASIADAPAAGFPGRSLGVCSGKGGVGKTTLSANLAVLAAELGADVLLVDLDLGLANVDVLFGLPPGPTLRDVLEGLPVERCVRRGPAGIRVLPGPTGLREMTRLAPPEIHRLIRRIGEVNPPPAWTLVDLPAGIGDAVVESLLAVDEILLVTAPDPVAVTDAYSLIKVLASRDRADRIHLVVNGARTHEGAFHAAGKLRAAARRFLGVDLERFGWVLRDDAVTAATVRQRLFFRDAPDGKAARNLRFLASKILSTPGGSEGR